MPATKVTVRPELLRWARTRAALGQEQLAERVGLVRERVTQWEETGEIEFAHLEKLANKTHTPVGYLFLSEPPDEELPVADFRRSADVVHSAPSPDLLATIYECQIRQAWFRDHLAAEGADRLAFVGSATLLSVPADVAAEIRAALKLDERPLPGSKTADTALRELVARIDGIGVLVMRNGVVGNNTSRKLNPGEFRGFALSDPFAPLIFINAADAKAAQMFTLAHELGHLWLGQSAVSDAEPEATDPTERFCNAVAAEVLVPLEQFRARWAALRSADDAVGAIAREFKVSRLVALIRAREAGALSHTEFRRAYNAERAALREAEPGGGGGGDFYATQRSRIGERFGRAVAASAMEGRTTYTEAFQLLGVRKNSTFQQLANEFGVVR